MNRFEGKNILFIYYKFPPIKGIGTLRNVKFYQSLKKNARKVFVATTSNRHFLPEDHFVFEEEDVIEIPTIDFRTLYHWMTGKQGSLLISRDTSPSNWLPGLKERFKNSILSQYFDEGGAYFLHKGLKRCSQLVREEKIDVIVSSFLPFDAHLLAYKLKRNFPDLYWIADYRDFFSDPMLRSSPHYDRLRKKHLSIIQMADEVTTVSKGLKKRFVNFHPNVHVVRNGIDQSMISKIATPKFKLFTLAYTGMIYPQSQDGRMLVSVLKELINEGLVRKNHIQLVNAGKDALYWKQILEKENLGDILVNRGIVSHKEALRIQRSAHINILLSWASEDVSGILTGKLFEYLAAGPPIFTIVNGIYDSELEELIGNSSRGMVFNNTELNRPKMKLFLLNKYQEWQNSSENTLPIQSLIPPPAGVITWQDEFDSWAFTDAPDGLYNSTVINL